MIQQTITILGSAAFAVAATSLIRKYLAPKLDGLGVLAVFAALSVSASLLAHYSAQLPPIVFEILSPLIALVLGAGGVSTGQQIADNAAAKALTRSEAWHEEAPTARDKPKAI